MMTRKQYLLLKLAEECNEAGHRAMKAMQFGMDEIQEGQSYTNGERLMHEIVDTLALIDMCDREFHILPSEAVIQAMCRGKEDRMQKYYRYAKDLKQVQ